jgi:hypothetical protein
MPPEQRRIHAGERFSSDDLRDGWELEKPEPRPEPEGATEPWARLADATEDQRRRVREGNERKGLRGGD